MNEAHRYENDAMKRRGMNNRETNMIYTLTHPLQLLYECLPHVRRSACCCCCRIRLYAMSSIQYYIIVFSLSLSLSLPPLESFLPLVFISCCAGCLVLFWLVSSHLVFLFSNCPLLCLSVYIFVLPRHSLLLLLLHMFTGIHFPL